MSVAADASGNTSDVCMHACHLDIEILLGGQHIIRRQAKRRKRDAVNNGSEVSLAGGTFVGVSSGLLGIGLDPTM